MIFGNTFTLDSIYIFVLLGQQAYVDIKRFYVHMIIIIVCVMLSQNRMVKTKKQNPLTVLQKRPTSSDRDILNAKRTLQALKTVYKTPIRMSLVELKNNHCL